MYAVLATSLLQQQGVKLAQVLRRNWSVCLSGAYPGCDIQTLPEAVCVDTGLEVGYGTIPISVSPIAGGPVRPSKLGFAGAELTPREIHNRFYGRTHLVFGWLTAEQNLMLPWDHPADFVSLVARDSLSAGRDHEAEIWWIAGWLVHIVGDSLIKSIHPGLSMKLLDGLYTAKNRPVQDLYTWHIVGIDELRLDWNETLDEVCRTPVQDIQLHAMHVTRPHGELSPDFPDGWLPADEQLVRAVCSENRRYLKLYLQQLLPQYQLYETGGELNCPPALSMVADGLTWTEMQQLTEKAGMRETLQQMAMQSANMIRGVFRRVPSLAEGV